MSKIQELIKELCPKGVEYKKLEEVCTFKRGQSITMKQLTEGHYPVVAGGQQPAFYCNQYNRDGEYITISGSGAYAGHVNYWNEKILCTDCFSLHSKDLNKLNNKFLYHYLKSNQNSIYISKKGAGIPHVHISDINKMKMPVPPLLVQEEIVRILDKFGKLEAELEAELEARQSQYEFWRGKLLNGNKEIKKYKLEDIAKFTYGFTGKSSDSGDARYVRITDIDENGYLLNNDCKYLNITNENSEYLLNKGDLVVARTGASFGKTLFFDSDIPSIYASFLIKIDLDNSKILNRYYWHFSKSSLYWNQANNLVSKAGQPQFNSNAIKKIQIPVPSIEVQNRIVEVLDKFDAICYDFGIGLPAEKELRQQQYEYYRDMLLTFADCNEIILQTDRQTDKR